MVQPVECAPQPHSAIAVIRDLPNSKLIKTEKYQYVGRCRHAIVLNADEILDGNKNKEN